MSSEMAGSRMLTAQVLAFTTSVEMQAAASTPLAWVPVCETLIEPPSRDQADPLLDRARQ